VDLSKVARILQIIQTFVPIFEKALPGAKRGVEKKEAVTNCVVANEEGTEMEEAVKSDKGRDIIGSIIDAVVLAEKILR